MSNDYAKVLRCLNERVTTKKMCPKNLSKSLENSSIFLRIPSEFLGIFCYSSDDATVITPGI